VAQLEPLGSADLYGDAVLVNFWTLRYINGLRQEPYVLGWSRAYPAWWGRRKRWRPGKQLPPSRRATGSKPRLLAVTAERSAYSVRAEEGVRGGRAEAPGLDELQVRAKAPGKGPVPIACFQ
jgi:hypothetical protein